MLAQARPLVTSTAMKGSPLGNSAAIAKAVIPASRGMVVSQHRRASKAGVEVLRAGGNAVDAAVATAFALGVLEPWMSGIGGGGYLLIGQRGEIPTLVDFSLRSPSGTRPEDYPIVEGKSDDLFPWPMVKDNRNTRGALSICAPTMVAGMELASRKFGTLPWEMLVEPSIEFAKEGLMVDWYTQLVLGSVAKDLRHEPVARSMFLDEGGAPIATQWTSLTQPTLCMGALPDTLGVIAKEGSEAVTRGDIGRALVEDVKDRGGILKMKDLAACPPQLTDPVGIRYRTNQVWSASGLSGGVTLMRILETLESVGMPADMQGLFYRALVDAIVPALQERQEKIGDCAANQNDRHCTTHFCTADANGLVVAATITLVSMFGSKVLSPQTGVMLNNGMSWFDPVPARPNSIGPGKRCLNNMAPALVDMPGHGMLALGAAGGRKIIPTVAQLIAFVIDGKLSLEDACCQPRLDVHSDRTIIVDERLDAGTISLLQDCGRVHVTEATIFPYRFGIASSLLLTDDTIEAAADPVLPRAGAFCC